MFCSTTDPYPERDEDDLRATLKAIKELDPITIFHEPINVRAENVARIQEHADTLGVKLKTDVFASQEAQQKYAMDQLKLVERLAEDVGVADRLHMWPDKSLGTKSYAKRVDDAAAHQAWLDKYWNRISEWPGKVLE